MCYGWLPCRLNNVKKTAPKQRIKIYTTNKKSRHFRGHINLLQKKRAIKPMSMLKSTHITSMNLKHQEDNNLRVFEKKI